MIEVIVAYDLTQKHKCQQETEEQHVDAEQSRKQHLQEAQETLEEDEVKVESANIRRSGKQSYLFINAADHYKCNMKAHTISQ